MYNMKKSILILIVFVLSSLSSINAQDHSIKGSKVVIAPNDSKIHIHGAKFVKMENGELVMHRHSDEVYAKKKKELRFNSEKAKSSTGISIRFKTSSPTVKINIAIGNEEMKKKPAGGFIGIYQAIDAIKTPVHTSPAVGSIPDDKFKISYEKGKSFTIDVKSKSIGSIVEYKITLPIFIDVNLVGLELEKGYNLVDYNKEVKPIYVAYGNSITHGRAQSGTSETYPYLLSEWMNWELYNTAVGGGKTSLEMAKMIDETFPHIDYMTVLIGYNDYAGAGESSSTYRSNYTDFINKIRENHPNTKIYCITVTATTTTKSPNSEYTAEQFRQVVRDIVGERQKEGDKSIYLIEGEDISEITDLKKKVHFTVEGALRVADKLYNEIELINK